MCLRIAKKTTKLGEFNVRFMVDVKNPSQVGANRRVIAMTLVILTLSHNTIVIALVCTDVGRVCWPPRVKLSRNSRWELDIGRNVRCLSR